MSIGLNLAYQGFKLKYARQHYGFSEIYGMSGAFLPPKRKDNVFVEAQDLLELSYSFPFKQWQLETKFGAMHYEMDADDPYISPLETSDFLINLDFKERNVYAQLEAMRDFNQHQLLFVGCLLTHLPCKYL